MGYKNISSITDTTPTKNSTNLITSGAVYESLQTIGTENIIDGAVTTDKLADDVVCAKNKIQIRGETDLPNYTYGLTYEKNGISLTCYGSNHIEISGTSTAFTSISIPIVGEIKSNSNYVFSLQNGTSTGTNTSVTTVKLMNDSIVIAQVTVNNAGVVKSASVTVDSDTVVNYLIVQIASGKTINVDFDVQLEEGTEATEYESPTIKRSVLPLNKFVVKTENIIDGAISEGKLSDGAVTSDKLADGAITLEKLTEDVKKNFGNDYVMNYLYVNLSYTEADDDFGISKFNSIVNANNSIVDNSETNRYTILIAPGIYTELQNLYKGSIDTSVLQGIRPKDYVYYEGADPFNPQATRIEWDGNYGYDEGVLTSAVAEKKCIFHITGAKADGTGIHTHIKNLYLKSKNTRYGLHIESGSYGRNVDWLVSDCIIEFGGRPDVVGGWNAPCCGMGVSPFEKGKFERCKFIYSSEAGATSSTSAINCHNNVETTLYTTPTTVKSGSKIIFEDCNFGGYKVNFATQYAPADTQNVAEIVNCINASNITQTTTEDYADSWKVKTD